MMGKCQTTWLNPADFTTKVCGAETERNDGDRFECQACQACLGRRIDYDRAMAEKMVCPRCGSALKLVPAKEMHPAHKDTDLARKCSKVGCQFICYMGDEED